MLGWDRLTVVHHSDVRQSHSTARYEVQDIVDA
jgi:hypothetical protein